MQTVKAAMHFFYKRKKGKHLPTTYAPEKTNFFFCGGVMITMARERRDNWSVLLSSAKHTRPGSNERFKERWINPRLTYVATYALHFLPPFLLL